MTAIPSPGGEIRNAHIRLRCSQATTTRAMGWDGTCFASRNDTGVTDEPQRACAYVVSVPYQEIQMRHNRASGLTLWTCVAVSDAIRLMYGIELILRYLVFFVVHAYVGDGNGCA